jgi:hypothetical protein
MLFLLLHEEPGPRKEKDKLQGGLQRTTADVGHSSPRLLSQLHSRTRGASDLYVGVHLPRAALEEGKKGRDFGEERGLYR